MSEMNYPEDLFYFMQVHDDDEAPDGAWQAMLEDAVQFYNEEHGTDYDSLEAFLAYLKWSKTCSP